MVRSRMASISSNISRLGVELLEPVINFIPLIPKDYVYEEAKRKNTTKARVRAKVEHPFRILKRVFGFTRVRYRGIWKNHQWLCAAFALVNLNQHRNRLAPQRA